MRSFSPRTVRDAVSPGALPLVATMFASFIISFSVMWWQRNEPSRSLSTPTVPDTARPESVATPGLQVSLPAPAARSAVGASRAVAAQPHATEDSSNGENKPELPVMFNIVKTTAYVDDENRSGAKLSRDVYEGIVTNNSEKTLDFTVIETNLPTMEKSEAGFSLAGGNQRHFGVAQGLNMLPGDQLTLRAESYREITNMIP